MSEKSAATWSQPQAASICAGHAARAFFDVRHDTIGKLEPLDLRMWLVRIGWVICGGESGKDARYMEAGLGREIFTIRANRIRCRS